MVALRKMGHAREFVSQLCSVSRAHRSEQGSFDRATKHEMSLPSPSNLYTYGRSVTVLHDVYDVWQRALESC